MANTINLLFDQYSFTRRAFKCFIEGTFKVTCINVDVDTFASLKISRLNH